MRFGVIYPQNELGHDPFVVKDFAQTVESLGYDHLTAYEHVLGANPNRPGGWQGMYTFKDEFIEPFVLFSYLAGVTHRIEFACGILILPQRQTALVAKQTASLDVLSGGRIRLGVGIGRNQVEYIALGEDFHRRGKKIEEQISVLRQLWASELVDYQGKWHQIPDAGINPLPVKKSIPIWMGGHADKVLERAARIADGWMTSYRTPAEVSDSIEKLDHHLVLHGRNRTTSTQDGDFGVEARIPYGTGDMDGWRSMMEGWLQEGVTHISFNTLGSAFKSPQEHLNAIRLFAEVAEL